MPAPIHEARLDLEVIEPVIGHACPASRLVWGQDHSVAAEKFRLLAHRLRRAKAKKPIQTVLVTSAVSAEGKSTIALNLAGILARHGSRTLLIDADLRAPAIHTIVGFDSLGGLSEVLSGHISLDRALRRVDPVGLYLLAGGARLGNPVPLLEGPAFPSILKQVRESFEWIILDSPPLNPLADAQCIAPLSDATLLVVRWGITPRRELEQALAVLDESHLLGIVINMFDNPQDPYYAYYDKPGSAPELCSGSALIDLNDHSGCESASPNLSETSHK
jgi:capsular exopolysaccharide synthesis family protein